MLRRQAGALHPFVSQGSSFPSTPPARQHPHEISLDPKELMVALWPPKDVQLLTLRTCEGNLSWKQGLCRWSR